MCRAKLCGIRSLPDLEVAIACGADAIGLISGVTHKSEDALEAEKARALAAVVPPYVSIVLVTHLTSADAILERADTVGADTIQVHGETDFETVRQVFDRRGSRRITKAIHVTSHEAVAEAERFSAVCDAIHLDSRTDDRLGGTGQTHDWSISRQIVERLAEHGKPCVLSGGLHPGNLADAIRLVGPYAVDVNSGVEDSSGDKSRDRCAQFVETAHTTWPPVPHDTRNVTTGRTRAVKAVNTPSASARLGF